MTSPYKKRAKVGWNSGKSHKKESNRTERLYESTEISEQVQEVTKSSSGKKRKGIHKKIERNISSYRSAISFINRWRSPERSECQWTCSIINGYKTRIKELTPELESYILREDADKKLIKQIKELLDV